MMLYNYWKRCPTSGCAPLEFLPRTATSEAACCGCARFSAPCLCLRPGDADGGFSWWIMIIPGRTTLTVNLYISMERSSIFYGKIHYVGITKGYAPVFHHPKKRIETWADHLGSAGYLRFLGVMCFELGKTTWLFNPLKVVQHFFIHSLMFVNIMTFLYCALRLFRVHHVPVTHFLLVDWPRDVGDVGLGESPVLGDWWTEVGKREINVFPSSCQF